MPTNFQITTWGAKQRPWGFEMRVDVIYLPTGRVFNEVLIFPNKAAALDARTSGDALQMLKDRIVAQLTDEVKPVQICPTCGRPL